MLSRIFPREIDNSYSGHRLGIWLLFPIILMKAVMGLTSMLIGDVVARGAHQVPLADFPPAARELLVLVLARSALATLVITLWCVLALIRYRAMIPLTYVLILLQHIGSTFFILKEAAITGTSKATGANVVLLALTILGLVSSLLGSSDSASREAAVAKS